MESGGRTAAATVGPTAECIDGEESMHESMVAADSRNPKARCYSNPVCSDRCEAQTEANTRRQQDSATRCQSGRFSDIAVEWGLRETAKASKQHVVSGYSCRLASICDGTR